MIVRHLKALLVLALVLGMSVAAWQLLIPDCAAPYPLDQIVPYIAWGLFFLLLRVLEVIIMRCVYHP